MSGIAGIFYANGKDVGSEALQEMSNSLAHRGQDNCGIWHEGPVGFCHRMFWTTPESIHELLPYVSQDGQRVITADARIDNREDLIPALWRTPLWEQVPDSVLILRAYEHWGEDCVDNLIGDFAFSIWDREKQALFCARDHMGIKPFYYYHSNEMFAFASEAKALICLADVPREINEAHIASWFAAIHDDGRTTAFKDILRLPAAHALTVGTHSATLRQYWSLDPKREIHFNTDEEYEAAFREILTEAVNCRLRSAFPVGLELSGGLGSSALTCVARGLVKQKESNPRVRAKKLHTFSFAFDKVPECDERFYVSAVVAQGDLEAHYVHPDELNPLAQAQRRLWYVEDSFAYFFNSFPYWTLYEAARDTGVRVLITGTWDDAVISHGQGALFDLTRELKWYTVLRESLKLPQNFLAPASAFLLSELVSPWLPRFVKRVWRKLRSDSQPPKRDLFFIRPDFAQRFNLLHRVQSEVNASDNLRTCREWHHHLLTCESIQYVLEADDKVAATSALELRAPYLDRRLVEFCLALPPEQRIRHGFTRAILRSSLAQLLPAEVRTRVTKMTADPFVVYCLLTFDSIECEHILFSDCDLIGRYLDVSRLRSAYRELTQGNPNDLRFVWRAIVLALWLRETGFKPSQELSVEDLQD